MELDLLSSPSNLVGCQTGSAQKLSVIGIENQNTVRQTLFAGLLSILSELFVAKARENL
jgi:hypothetical protein